MTTRVLSAFENKERESNKGKTALLRLKQALFAGSYDYAGFSVTLNIMPQGLYSKSVWVLFIF